MSESLKLGCQSCLSTPAEPCLSAPKQNARGISGERSPGTRRARLRIVKAYRVKKVLRLIRRAESKQVAKWNITNFIKHAADYAATVPY